MERLGVGPDECLTRNPRLVYGRMTGWGQSGPYAQAAGHDINYIALAGALAHFARPGEPPLPPLNLVGDFGGGAMFLAFGMMCALFERQLSGKGQVVDAAMVDGTALLMTMAWSMRSTGSFREDAPGENLLDTGAPFYDVYRCADGRYISLGSIEPQFFAELVSRLGLADDVDPKSQYRRGGWPDLRSKLTALFGTKTSAEWCALLEHTDVCFAPVLRMSEAASHPHNVERATFVEADGVLQPAPAPRFSRTAPELSTGPARPGQHTYAVLSELGFDEREINQLMTDGVAA